MGCGSVYEADPWLFQCPKCRNLLEVVMPESLALDWAAIRAKRVRGVWRYSELLPLNEAIEPVTLGEGGTPLVKILRAAPRARRAFLKFEGANPTGSFKDRGMTLAVTIAKQLNVKGVVVASTGNTAASAAAYAARAHLRCVVVLPRGGVALGKLAQAILHGAEIMEINGAFDEALEEVFHEVVLNGRRDLYPLNSYNPWRLEGQKTLAFEVVDELTSAPDAVFVPVGNAGNIAAIWKGFKELYLYGIIDKLPRMFGVQAMGAAPLVETWKKGAPTLISVSKPETVASAIRIGRPINWLKAMRAVKESGGSFIAVSDEEILGAMKLLARSEGVGVEPASAAALAGLLRALDEGLVDGDELCVLVGTGHALKDPEIIINHVLKQ